MHNLSRKLCFPLSSRAKRGICFFFGLALAFVASSASGQTPPNQPRITGIDHVRIYATDINKSREFYPKLFGVRSNGGACNDKSGRCFTVGWAQSQRIELEKAPASGTKSFVTEIAFASDDVEKMRSYLVAHGVTASKTAKYTYAKQTVESYFEIHDPEGNPISFIQRFAYPVDDPGPHDPWFVHIIHAGLIVHDRAAMEHFYKDILGFRPYWHGGRRDDGVDDWVSFQVPDGTDWVEFMLNVPENADKHLRGVMNHIALGVADIHATQEQLRKNGWTGTEEPKIGRDGKWQLNLYDPDDTRIEFMEFTPKGKTCCSEFTAPHPKP